jgi:GntR family transcriptional regulator / MocR family aminotransferase
VTESQANISSDLLLELTGTTGPAYRRLAHALREAIQSGRLPAGSTVPPSRALASQLGWSRWVVTEAYAQLGAEGYLAATVGSGTRIRRLEHVPGGRASEQSDLDAGPGPATEPVIDMAPGLPDLRNFPMGPWISAIRAAAARMASADLGYPDAAGLLLLRHVLADYLARVRGAHTDASDLLITAGATDAIGLLCRMLRTQGCTAVAMEDPGWHRLREVVTGTGLRPVPIPVDDQGLRADLLQEHPEVGAVVVTAAHQFPTGVVLSSRRRELLLGWASQRNRLIIEDDYDAEFRYDRRPVGALQGAGPSVVALTGSVTKTLAPAVGLGWAAIPPAWTPLVRATIVRSSGPPILDQLAFAEFLRTGRYDRHLRAARIRYRTRRDGLVRALAVRLPDSRVCGVSAGLHFVLYLPAGSDAPAVISRAAHEGVRVANLDTYRFTPAPELPGLVLGYGNLADHQVQEAVTRLTSSVRA